MTKKPKKQFVAAVRVDGKVELFGFRTAADRNQFVKDLRVKGFDVLAGDSVTAAKRIRKGTRSA